MKTLTGCFLCFADPPLVTPPPPTPDVLLLDLEQGAQKLTLAVIKLQTLNSDSRRVVGGNLKTRSEILLLQRRNKSALSFGGH